MSPDMSEPQEVRADLLTVAQVARRLGLSKVTIYELLNKGLIESVHIGRSRRIPTDAVDDYIARLRTVEA